MKNLKAALLAGVLSFAVAGAIAVPSPALAITADELSTDSDAALQKLYRENASATILGKQAKAILVFPNIVKAGFVFGAAYGEGEMKQAGKRDGYFSSFTGSWGLQAGAQSYGYVVFLMTQKAVDYIHQSSGWEIGVGPTVVVVDEGLAKNLSTSTLKDDAYAFIFDQKGLMAGISIEGTKISRMKQ